MRYPVLRVRCLARHALVPASPGQVLADSLIPADGGPGMCAFSTRVRARARGAGCGRQPGLAPAVVGVGKWTIAARFPSNK